MGAAKGNKNWITRVKVGRPRKFETPEALWEAALDYFDYCEKNPWYKNELVRGGMDAGIIVQVPTARPYSIKGMLVHMGMSNSYWTFLRANAPDEFNDVIERIDMIIETQQFEGAVVGAFNPGIISKKLGLKDCTEVTYNPVKIEPTEVIFKDFSKK